MQKSDSFSNCHWKKPLMIIQSNHLLKVGSVKFRGFYTFNNGDFTISGKPDLVTDQTHSVKKEIF